MTSAEKNDVLPSHKGRSEGSRVCKSERMDADQGSETRVEESGCCNTLTLCALSKRCVDVLLDISEEISVREQEAYEIPNQTSWDEAMQGWGRCSPFSCLFIAQQKSKKLKPEISASHCVLCAELKDLKLSQRLDLSHAASEPSDEIPEEPLRSNIPPTPEHLNKTSSTITSTSSSEEEEPAISDFTLKENDMSPVLLGPEQYTPDQVLHHPARPETPWPFLKGRNVGKVALLGRVMVLPPLRVPTRPHFYPKSLNLFKRRGEDSAPRSDMVSEKVDQDQEKAVGIYPPSSTLGTIQESLMSKQGPLIQHQYDLVSTLNMSKRNQSLISTFVETQPSAMSLGRKLRQNEQIRSPLRRHSGHRSRLGLKDRSPRRAEPELPMLLGTKVQIPVSTQRLL